MEAVTFDPDLTIEDNLEKVLEKAEKVDPGLTKILREHLALITAASTDAARKSGRTMFHKLSKDRLDKLVTGGEA